MYNLTYHYHTSFNPQCNAVSVFGKYPNISLFIKRIKEKNRGRVFLGINCK